MKGAFLVPRPHYSARPKSFRSCDPSKDVCFPARSPRILHRSELIERDWENVVQRLGKLPDLPKMAIAQMYGNPTQYWILDSTLWIPDSKYTLSVKIEFQISVYSGIPDSLGWILHSKAEDSGFRNPAITLHGAMELPTFCISPH